jgi:hypothetical protein
MFGAIIGVAAKLIGGGAAAGGAGGILGSLGGGLLGSLFQGGPLKEIFDMVSNFKTNFLGGADQQPPLGNFGQRDEAAPTGDRRSAAQGQLLDRIERLLDRLERLRGGQEGNQEDGCRCSDNGNNPIDRIRDLLRQLLGDGNDQNQASIQFSRSQFLNIQV